MKVTQILMVETTVAALLEKKNINKKVDMLSFTEAITSMGYEVQISGNIIDAVSSTHSGRYHMIVYASTDGCIYHGSPVYFHKDLHLEDGPMHKTKTHSVKYDNEINDELNRLRSSLSKNVH